MTRRAAAGFARYLPVLLVLGALAIVGAAVAYGDRNGGSPEPTLTATGTASSPATPASSPSPSPSPSETAAARTPVTLYFMRNGTLCAVERRLPGPTAEAVLTALLRGPTNEERAAGVTTSIPRGVRLLGFSRDGDEAVIDLSGEYVRSADAAQVRSRMAEVVYTATGMRSLGERATRATLCVRGEPITALPSSDGDVELSPSRDGYRQLEPAIFVEHPGLGAVLTNPFKLSGTASVFEGSFTARLIDSSERRIVNAVLQASRGAPERGSFSKTIAFSTSAASGTLIVYTQSMDDGSRQNVVRIPVSFAEE